MSTTSVAGISGQSGPQDPTQSDPMAKLTSSDFIKMLVAEMQNQDPTQPMDNSQVLQEISQIDAVEANQQLSTTLQSMMLGQNLSAANNLLQRTIQGTTASGQSITGPVTSVTVQNNTVQLNVGNSAVPLNNVTGIVSSSSGS
ncbi:MAG: flagellar hook capping FlgD N-terminal domain-containing protein [Thermoguttaceae bacterium]|jgi:flagellar basal-body rod modification protein FlgD